MVMLPSKATVMKRMRTTKKTPRTNKLSEPHSAARQHEDSSTESELVPVQEVTELSGDVRHHMLSGTRGSPPEERVTASQLHHLRIYCIRRTAAMSNGRESVIVYQNTMIVYKRMPAAGTESKSMASIKDCCDWLKSFAVEH